MGVTGGGGYAEIARIDYRMAIPVPDELNFIEAAAIPEAFMTAHEALFHLGGLDYGQTVLIHAAAGGIGSAAVQLAHEAGARTLFTASANRIADVMALGGQIGIDYRRDDFGEVVAEATEGEGVDVVIDFIGGPYLERNVRALKEGGRLIQVGLMSGSADGHLPLDLVLLRYLRIIGTVMKSRPQAEKHAMTARFRGRWLTSFADGALRPVIDSVFPLEQAAAAHSVLEGGGTFGKIVLTTH
jgi:NADPH:quinone reductase-like Zn-dependent oxidoreductase